METKEPKQRRTVKQKLAETIRKRVEILEKRLSKYTILIQELNEYKQMLKVLTGESKKDDSSIDSSSKNPEDYFNNDDSVGRWFKNTY